MGTIDPAPWALEVVDRFGVAKGILAPVGFSVTSRLNGVSELRMSVEPSSDGAKALEQYSRVIRAWRRPPGAFPSNPGRIIRFAGHVHDLGDAGDADGSETCEVVARDPFAAMIVRYQPWESSWGTPSVPAPLNGAVVQQVADLNISAEDPGGIDASYPHGLSVVTVGAGWANVNLSWSKHTPAEAMFRALQEGEAGTQGFYWTVKPNDPIINAAAAAAGTIAYLWIAVAPGSLSGVATSRPRLEYGPGTLNSVASYQARRLPPINSVIALGANGISWKNDSESSGATYGLWPTLVSYLDVDTTAKLDVLARGVWHVFPGDLISVELPAATDPAAAAAAPMLWDDFEVGDSLPVLIRGARRTISGNALVREATVAVDAEGNERLSGMVLDLAGVS
jgi:hypothetical protein